MTIKIAIRCPNNMVAVFDEHGRQMPEYQGHYHEVRDKILKDALADCRFEADRNGLAVVDRNDW